ncbi:hypothetical protein [Microbulbifer sp. TRSA007]|uniref:hypothetical protein n=1 Tax=unclassified Microbulbifer TaxID=2619833 RepID=UPI00403A450E
MKLLILTIASIALTGCIEPILFTSCAVEKPFTSLVEKTKYFEAKMVFTSELGEHEAKTTIQCNVVDYLCHAGEMGLAEVWETVPAESITLSAPLSDSATFKIGTPNCSGLVNSNNAYLAGRESYSYWQKPRIESAAETTNVSIWYPEHRKKFDGLGIKGFKLTVVQVDSPALKSGNR